jgi:hypothetical protein
VRRRKESDSDLRPVPIIEALDRHGVRYVAVGSYAAIAQGVDLDLTDFDIVPATDHENLARLVDALKHLGGREKIGASTEPIYDLGDDPISLTDTIFGEFATQFGKLDVVLRPEGFPRGYEDLVEHVVIVEIRDELEQDRTVEVVMADKAAVYESKRAAGRRKDIEALAKFDGIHAADVKQALREKYPASQTGRGKAIRSELAPLDPPLATPADGPSIGMVDTRLTTAASSLTPSS